MNFENSIVFFVALLHAANAFFIGTCPPLYTPHAISVCSDGYVINSTCVMACDEGFSLVGFPRVTCQARPDGSVRWFPQLPYCQGFHSQTSLILGAVSYGLHFGISVAIIAVVFVLGLFIRWIYTHITSILRLLTAIRVALEERFTRGPEVVPLVEFSDISKASPSHRADRGETSGLAHGSSQFGSLEAGSASLFKASSSKELQPSIVVTNPDA